MGAGVGVPFSVSAMASVDSVTKENARGLLRLMEKVVIDTAKVAEEQGKLQVEEEKEEQQQQQQQQNKSRQQVELKDVLIGAAVTAVLTPSFYALFGGAEDFAPLVYAVQDAVRSVIHSLWR